MAARLARKLALRNLRSDGFGTLSAVLGVALGTATVNVVLTLDANTRALEARRWETNPDLPVARDRTVTITPLRADGAPLVSQDAREETHEDYQVMRSAIRLGSLSAFLVGALIVFFTFRVVIEQRRREIALLRGLGASARQVAGVFLLEAALVGMAGGALGFALSVPLSVLAAVAGITTTGRAQLHWLWFPWRTMLFVSAVGAATAVLGVLRPLREVLRLDLPRTLNPQAVTAGASRRPRGVGAIALPFSALLYVLIRPFFSETLPSLAFFVLEAGLACAGFLSTLVLVPELVARLGGLLKRLVPARAGRAARLLTERRVERAGHELSWAVSGVMMVFALLLALHVVTHALRREVSAWAASSVRGNVYVVAHTIHDVVDPALLADVPPEVLQVRFTGRTPWPDSLMAVDGAALARLARASDPASAPAASRLGPGKVLVSRMMARRHGVGPGDLLEVRSRARTARLEVVGVSDVGYLPIVGPYRDSKTFGVLDLADADLVAPYARPLGAGVVLRHPDGEQPASYWHQRLAAARATRGLGVEIGREFEAYRLEETRDDFVIFDLILLLTAALAAVGIANNLVLSTHVRRREIALYRVLGMTPEQLRRLYLLEGAFIGALGGVMAVALGVPLGYAAIGALRAVSAFEVAFALPPHYVPLTIAGALLTSLAAALYPSRLVSRQVRAVDVRHE